MKRAKIRDEFMAMLDAKASIERVLLNNPSPFKRPRLDSSSPLLPFKTKTLTKTTVEHVRAERKRHDESIEKIDLGDEGLAANARFIDEFALEPYKKFLQFTPRLVNVVTVTLVHQRSLFWSPSCGLTLAILPSLCTAC